MIIDSHAHVWVQNPEAYPWSPIGEYIPSTDAPVDRFLELIDHNQVSCAVLVQPTPYGWDNRYLFDAVNSAPEKFRSVCLVDPFSFHNDSDIVRLVDLHGASGFRINWHLHPIDRWQTNHNHQKFWSTIAELNKPVCIQCTPDYFPLVKTYSNHFSDIPVIIDHFGRLNFSSEESSDSFNALLSLSDTPNVYVKISGLNYCSRQDAPYLDSLPFLEEILKAFSARRCLWGSDYPFIQQHWEYAAFVEWIKQIEFLTDEELQWLLFKTARKLWW